MTVLAGSLLLFLLAVWLAHLRPHPQDRSRSSSHRLSDYRNLGVGSLVLLRNARSRATIVGMKLVGMLVVVAALIGMVISGIEEMVLGGEDPQDYPPCYELVSQLGTDPNAECRSGDDVITVKFDPAWKHFHPGQ